MQQFYVKIISCERETYWYKDRIGETFFVEEDGALHDSWKVVELRGSWILKADCANVLSELAEILEKMKKEIGL